jgi:hypothetical protein
MKHLYTMLLVSFLPTMLVAQGWFPNAAQWHHGYAWGTAVGYVRTEVNGDTIVNGLSGRRLQRTRETYN